jgi:hypothetical protein
LYLHMEASQHSLLAACFTLHSINATLAIVPQRGAGLWIENRKTYGRTLGMKRMFHCSVTFVRNIFRATFEIREVSVINSTMPTRKGPSCNRIGVNSLPKFCYCTVRRRNEFFLYEQTYSNYKGTLPIGRFNIILEGYGSQLTNNENYFTNKQVDNLMES